MDRNLQETSAMTNHDPSAPAIAEGMPATVGVADSLRAAIAGGEAARLLGTSAMLFEAGGKHVLSATAQKAVRQVAERGAEGAILLAAGPVLDSASSLAKGMKGAKAALSLGAKASKGALVLGTSKQAMRVASKEILKGAGKAAGIGFVLDGAVASLEAVVAVRNGSSDKKTAVKYVLKEATKGAVATGAGVLLGATLVALTGGVAAPVVFAVGAIGSIGTKQLLRKLTTKKG
ncbi:hypothetical protein BH11MYX4_BH11MYX4_21340 [soil metagenome]